ncbi:hypothetical protein CLAIMM_14120 [Cladophialophora immunda]|nr:hypothetical protein CLAIMM_14120 [Cladophialophora immunda]
MTQAILIATIYPQPGKADRIVELLLQTAKVVHAEEPYVTEYSCYREINFQDGQEDIIMFERYTSLENQNVHMGVPHVVKLLKTWEEEDLLRRPPLIKNVEHVGGFAGR